MGQEALLAACLPMNGGKKSELQSNLDPKETK
jgi:hypothetical protein